MQAIVYSDYPLPTFHNLTELEVSSDAVEGWELLPDLLDNAPCLEVLSFSSVSTTFCSNKAIITYYSAY